MTAFWEEPVLAPNTVWWGNVGNKFCFTQDNRAPDKDLGQLGIYSLILTLIGFSIILIG